MNLKKYMNMYFVQSAQFHFLNQALDTMRMSTKLKPRIRDWVVNPPTNGFVFPAFIDRSTDVNSVMYYTKNVKDPHPELMEKALGCSSKQTATIQKESFSK